MNKHPSKNELSGFILGKLPPDETEAVADHLGECPPCQHTLQEIEAHKDTLIKNLRQPAPASLETDPECRRAVEYVAGLVPMGQAEGRREACAAPATVAGVAQPSVVGQPGAPVPSVASSGETPVPAASLGRLREYELLEKLGQGGMGTV